VSDPTWFSAAALNRSRWGELVEPFLQRIALARDRDRFPHALLLVGPRGLGRELAAVEAAVMLACDGAQDPWSVSPCAERVRGGTHPDVRAVLPEGKSSKIKIEQIRAIADEASSRPYEANCRVWILDGVESAGLVPAAANAFLKTLEEPPKHVRLLLLAENPDAVLPTIRSRCQQLSLPGAAVVAEGDLAAGVPPELAASVLAGVKIDGLLAEVRSALEAGISGELRHLLRLPYLVGDKINPFELVAAVATEMATQGPDAERSEDLIRLAADLLATDRRRRALNLSSDRQLVSCLLRWFQGT
jgi:DNA polymerase-3 subunit delta'